MKSRVIFFLFISLFLLSLIPAEIEDFTTYNTFDPESDMTINKSSIDVNKFKNNLWTWANDDKGAGYFGEMFEHTYSFIQYADDGYGALWGISNVVVENDTDSWTDLDEDACHAWHDAYSDPERLILKCEEAYDGDTYSGIIDQWRY